MCQYWVEEQPDYATPLTYIDKWMSLPLNFSFLCTFLESLGEGAVLFPPLNLWIFEPLDFESLDLWTFGSLNLWIFEPLDLWTSGSLNHLKPVFETRDLFMIQCCGHPASCVLLSTVHRTTGSPSSTGKEGQARWNGEWITQSVIGGDLGDYVKCVA